MSTQRPLSPFMFPTWYRFQLTSALSILHRLAGIALSGSAYRGGYTVVDPRKMVGRPVAAN